MMKKYNLFQTTILAAALTCVGSACSDDLELHGAAGDENTISLTLSYPYYIETHLSTRSFEDNANIYMAYYNGANFIKQISLGNGQKEFSSDNNSITVAIPKEAGATNLHFFVGYDPQLSSSKNPASITLDNADQATNYMWGIYDLNGSSNSVKLLHPIAQISLTEQLDNFTLLGYEVYGLSTKGSLITSDYNMSPSAPTIPAGNSITPAPSSVSNNTSLRNVFETANDDSSDDFGSIRIIVKGRYGVDQTEYFYPLFFGNRVDSEGEEANGFSEDPETFSDIELVDIIRNHKYILNISYVRAAGWTTLEEALAAKPDNRLAVEITDQNDNITDIIACRDYALGVQASELSVSGALSVFSFETVHTFNGGESSPSVSIAYPSGENQWITASTVESAGDADMYLSSEKTAKGKKYNVNLSLTQNTSITDSHVAYITVKVGDLTRTVTLTQLPRDYMRGEDREVILIIPGYTEPITTNYFAWIDQTDPNNYCFGVRPEDNQGEIRNKGLIFSPLEVYSGQISYLIPKKDDDSQPSADGFSIEVYTSGTGSLAQYNNNYWEVKMVSYPEEIKKPTMTILNSQDGDIVYNLYIAGFFHELTSDMISSYVNPVSAPAPGWYYYEFMQKEPGYFILDRNIGATTNAPYKSTNIGYRANKSALGGYFKIATGRYYADVNGVDDNFSYWNKRYYSDKTILQDLNLPENQDRLHIPTKGDMSRLELTLGRPSSETDSEANVLSVETTSIDGTVAKVYIPHGGYYEDNTLKLPTRANLWTSTIYCEPQGFHPNVAKFSNTNFGFWYYYLDGQTTDENLTKFGEIRCTDANADDFSDALIFRYMPIRLVWGTADTADESSGSGDSSNSGSDTPNYETPAKGTNIFLRGTFNEWKTDNPAWEFNVVKAGSEYLSDYVEIPNGSAFKIGGKWEGSDEGWSTYNFGRTDLDNQLVHNVLHGLGWDKDPLYMQNDFHGYIRFKHNGQSNSTIIAETVNPFQNGITVTIFVKTTLRIENRIPKYVKYWFDDESNSPGYYELNTNTDGYYYNNDALETFNPQITDSSTYKIYFRLATDLNGSNQTHPYIITSDKLLYTSSYYLNKLD